MYNSRIPAVLVDIDGVVTNVVSKLQPDTFNWNDYMVEAQENHEPIMAGVELVQFFDSVGLQIVYVTARPEFMRYQTKEMLTNYKIGDSLINKPYLYMTPSGAANQQYGSDYKKVQARMKNEMVGRLVKQFNFKYALDDQSKNCHEFRQYGIPTLQAWFLRVD